MKHLRFLFLAITWMILAQVSLPQDRAQETNNLPPVHELLKQATHHIAKLEPDSEQARLYRKSATLFARSGDIDAAYRTLGKIQIRASRYSLSADNQKRVGFLELAEALALHADAETAIRTVKKCPKELQAYRDDAFGRIALGASQRQDSEGTWKAIDQIDQPYGLYPYELVAAQNLGDKVQGKKTLLNRHREWLSALEDRQSMSREEWLGIAWQLSFYKWLGLDEQAKQLLDRVCETANDPDQARKAMLTNLNYTTDKETAEPKKLKTKKPSSRSAIRLLITMANESKNPRAKAGGLLNAAKRILDIDKPVVVNHCD